MYASKFVGAVKLEGTAITSLVGKGRAYVARSLEDAQDIQNGDILITYTTDIGWSPYFPLVSGVVTELGGLNSHGAVIAREFGLPCIVGVANACELFKTGDTILVDGERGLVTKLAEN
ncbi:putative phosphoenolpyruvate synthase-like protein [Leptotrombidium deliense]|uniref:Putative phosphoenolpyruvate synthase-like protein n=1 Tax=Leptotrombidium deliense TaxID=299467 RepID=A0A443SJJ8_9ACAR|nr:putative phosphoenolpyruvate synthase-like protein [Leptotrombidium deliense]